MNASQTARGYMNTQPTYIFSESLISSVFSALRVFALWERNWTVFTVVLSLGMFQVTIGLVRSLCYLLYVTTSNGILKFTIVRSIYGYLGPPYSVCNQQITFSEGLWAAYVSSLPPRLDVCLTPHPQT